MAIARAQSRAMSAINPRLPPALVQEGTNSLNTADHVERYKEQTNNKVKTFQLEDNSIASGATSHVCGVRRSGNPWEGLPPDLLIWDNVHIR